MRAGMLSVLFTIEPVMPRRGPPYTAVSINMMDE